LETVPHLEKERLIKMHVIAMQTSTHGFTKRHDFLSDNVTWFRALVVRGLYDTVVIYLRYIVLF